MQTIYVLEGITDEGKRWIENNVHYENYQMIGQGIAVEHRYIGDIVEGMKLQGLLEDQDFRVR